MQDTRYDLILFYVFAIVPIIVVFIIGHYYGKFWLGASWLTYTLVYSPVLYIIRLLRLEKIEEKDAWKLFIPLYQARYLKSIWLGK